MEGLCKNCNREIFPGQRFCRFCGRPTDHLPEDHLPTQAMPPQDVRGGRGANTAPPPQRPETSPVYSQNVPYYQPPTYPQAPLPPYTPPRSRSPWGWVIALVSIGLFAAVVLGVFIFTQANLRPRGRPPAAPPAAVAPPMPGETPLGEEGANVSSRETTFKNTFPLASAAKFSLNNVRGDIRVQTWDQPKAEITVTKRGGSAQDRQNVKVVYSTDGGNLFLKTAQGRGGVEVEYEIKLPRTLKQVEVASIASDVKISDVKGDLSVKTQSGVVELSDIQGIVSIETQSGSIEAIQIIGDISANSQSGSIELSDVTGSAKVNTISGDTSVGFEKVALDKPLQFNTVSGDIDLRFKSDINLNLEVRTVSGDIELDDSLGLTVNSQPGRKSASGAIGKGGQPFRVETISGDITIAKQP